MNKYISNGFNRKEGSKATEIPKFSNPYNFVPMNEKVYEVDRSENISHDIPFRNGKSGTITVSFETVTPVIVKEGNSPDSVNFKNNPFIPATSIKGMTRNVLEILALSKITTLTQNDRYSMRDLSVNNKDYRIKQKLSEVKPGFLIQIRGKYHLIECEKYERLGYNEKLADILEDGELSKLEAGKLSRNIKRADTVADKYDMIDNWPFYFNDDDSEWVMVFSGKMFNKKAEYGFKIPNNIEPVPIPKKNIDDFRFIYETETKSQSWKFWKKHIKNFDNTPTKTELSKNLCFAPVFYMKDEKELLHMGLTFLYREPYQYSIHDLVYENHKQNEKLDLAEAIFGTIGNYKLKGRVMFSNAFFWEHTIKVEEEIVLGSPKPTFFPFYLKQKNNENYSTFSNPEAKINGWKRYLIQQNVAKQSFVNHNVNVRTKIKPLDKGSAFICKIQFHNLREVELGALLSALTFHGNQNKCFHSIGMGKPLGYGKIKLASVILSCDGIELNPTDYMASFEKEICDKIFNGKFEDWEQSIIKLFEFSSNSPEAELIRYPIAFEEFKSIKKQNVNIADFEPESKHFVLKSLTQ